MRTLLRENRALFFFPVVANLLRVLGHNVWRAMFNKLAVESIGVGADAIGWAQSIRELSGLLAFVVAFLALLFNEARIMAFSLVVLGLGIIFMGEATTFPAPLISILVMSLGSHHSNPGNNGLIVMSVNHHEAPRTIGQLRSLGAIVAVLATGSACFFGEWALLTCVFTALMPIP